LTNEEIEWDEYFLAFGRYTKNLALTSVGSGHLWIFQADSMGAPAKTYKWSKGSGLGHKVGPVQIFQDNANGPNRLVTCNRFDPKEACITFDYGTGNIRYAYTIDQITTLKRKHVVLQVFVESAYFVVIYDNIMFIMKDRYEHRQTATGRLYRGFLNVQGKKPSSGTVVYDKVGVIASIDLADRLSINQLKDGFNYKKAMFITSHELVDTQFSFDIKKPAPLNENPQYESDVCARSCGIDDKFDIFLAPDASVDNYVKTFTDSTNSNNPGGNLFAAVQSEIAMGTANGNSDRRNRCLYAFRSQDCRVDTYTANFGSGVNVRNYGVCATDHYWKTVGNAYEPDVASGSILKCKLKTPGLTTSLNGKFDKPGDLSFSTTGNVCTNSSLSPGALDRPRHPHRPDPHHLHHLLLRHERKELQVQFPSSADLRIPASDDDDASVRPHEHSQISKSHEQLHDAS
jgi:hypothetical protein